MNDERITHRHRVIAFDMPWHGKSSPPSGWHNEEYQLTSAQYTTMILEIMTALDLERPILIGCSIGGRIALHLALEHPDRFRAIIGLQAGAHVDPYYDLTPAPLPISMAARSLLPSSPGLVGPDAPDGERWETLWHYMQGGPGVFKGDLHFYKLDGDIRRSIGIDTTSRCPLFLLSGEYDHLCTPEETLAVAKSVPGSEATIMKGLGHFPMSETRRSFSTICRCWRRSPDESDSRSRGLNSRPSVCKTAPARGSVTATNARRAFRRVLSSQTARPGSRTVTGEKLSRS